MKTVKSALSRLGLAAFETLGITALFAGLVVAWLALTPGSAAADEGVEAAGKNRYMDYCGVCHGADGKGAGPFANMLNKRPSDLTVLSKNAGGTFPFDRVFETIDGRGNVGGAHGSKEMPIWGAEWKIDNVVGSTALRGRILEMIIYLRSIQQ
jgi:mono/diheme cytochrome c family protein